MHPDDHFQRFSTNPLRGVQRNTALVVLAASVGIALALMLSFVLVYQVAYADRIYPGVKAFGYELGGYSRNEAGVVLQRGIDEMSRRQLTLQYAEHSWTFTAQELGLKAEVAPVLDSVYAVGREGNFLARFWTQFGVWQGGRSFEQPAAAFDPSQQTTLLQRLGRDIERPVVEPKVTVHPDYRVELKQAQSGRQLDVEASRKRLQEALSAQSATSVELVVQETMPKNAENNLERARDQASRILSAPITLTYSGRNWTLDRAELASILQFDERLDATDAAFLPREPLVAWAESLAAAVNQAPEDARFSWAGGRLDVIRPSRDGLKVDVQATVDAIIAESRGEHRPIPLPVEVARPAVPAEDRHNLGIKTLIESARTPFAGSVPAKQENITLAARRLNGAVVPPGATFSFNKELGSTSLEAGFKIGWGITTVGGNMKTVPSVAGGICQVATTLFHAVFWSGYQIEERNWHLYWIPSYTSKGVLGLDATVDEEAGLDFQFINTTPHHLLIQSWVDDAQYVNFALYGTPPDWVVKVEPSVKTDVIPAETQSTAIEEEPTMPEGNRLQVERAMEGFTVTNIRHVQQNGDDRTLNLVSRYRPSRNVVLVGTGGRPASGRTVVEQNKPSEESKPTPTPGATATPKPEKTPTPTASERNGGQSGASTKAPTRTPAPTKERTERAEPTATPKKR